MGSVPTKIKEGISWVVEKVKSGASWLLNNIEHLLECTPLVGYAVALYHLWIKNDRAKALRAVAMCTNSTITTICSVLGAFLGPLGAVSGGTLGNVLGQMAEMAINGCNRPEFQTDKGTFHACTDANVLTELIITTITGVLSSTVGKFAAQKAAAQFTKKFLKEAAGEGAEYIFKKFGLFAVEKSTQTAVGLAGKIHFKAATWHPKRTS